MLPIEKFDDRIERILLPESRLEKVLYRGHLERRAGLARDLANLAVE